MILITQLCNVEVGIFFIAICFYVRFLYKILGILNMRNSNRNCSQSVQQYRGWVRIFLLLSDRDYSRLFILFMQIYFILSPSPSPIFLV